ncbi:chitin-binding protein [Chania multitudinisentens RB-25]|uniref:Chitin-binding protein n=1 Tax=Chania multitudinisentens RB-25 TaxID=1441930 RepID=W0L9J8_9GAMM|nr:lytic polysaccharide monooxygenase [Chania multitudinisentens]AHG18937.1 chitin-binding protein [Chania multitudinisentens RB-25]
MKKTSYTLLSLSLLSISMWGVSMQSSAHGYVESPASRAYQCRQELNTQCGSIQYEPQSVEGPKGFPQSGPPDGHIASGNKAPFFELDQQSPSRWNTLNLQTGDNSFTWHLTQPHRTTSWRYFITQQGWNTAQPLTRASFDLVPFCQFDEAGAIPETKVVHHCNIPTDRSGPHVILAVWDIADTGNAFYQAIDVNLSH